MPRYAAQYFLGMIMIYHNISHSVGIPVNQPTEWANPQVAAKVQKPTELILGAVCGGSGWPVDGNDKQW